MNHDEIILVEVWAELLCL